MLRTLTITILLLSTGFNARSQVDLGLGAELGFPLMFNKNVKDYNHSLGSPGLRASLSYRPEEATVIPALVISMASVQLPMVRIWGDNVLYMDFTSYSAMFSARIRKPIDNKELQFGMGVGVSYLKGRGVGVNGSNIKMGQLLADSSELMSLVAPALNINAEYILPISSEVPLYAGIGAQIQYVYFFDKERSHRVHFLDQQSVPYSLEPQLYGHMFNPMAYLTVYYRFGQRDRY